MRIIYFGNGERGFKCLEALCNKGFHICAVVVHPQDSTLDRNPASIPLFASEKGLQIYDPKNVNSSGFIETVNGLKPDLMILSGYNQILRETILSIPKKGTINLHGGLLPDYRGGSPINWQIINGETKGACTILFLDKGIDTGDIIVQEEYPIGENETGGDIIETTLKIFPKILINVVEKLANDEQLKTRKQIPKEGAYYCKRIPMDGRIIWDKHTAHQVHNMIRALNGKGLPGAFTCLKGEKIILWESERIDHTVKGVPGRIALKVENGVIVIAADKGVKIKTIKINGKIVKAKSHFKICGLSFDI